LIYGKYPPSHSRKKGRPGDKWHAKVRAAVAWYQTYAGKGEENREGSSGYLSPWRYLANYISTEPLCPVVAVLTYVTRTGSGPLFKFSNGKPLPRQRFVVEVKEALDQSGINSAQYSGNSFRSRAATTAVRLGMGDEMLGRWKSDAYRVYIIKTPRSQLAAISRVLEKGSNK
jgi:hypothetical protein